MIRSRPWSQNGSLPNLLANTHVSYPRRSLHTLDIAQGGEAAVELRQLDIHRPRTIRCNESLCTTTRCSAQLPVPDRIYWLVSDPVEPGVCRMLQSDFREYPFYEIGCIRLFSSTLELRLCLNEFLDVLSAALHQAADAILHRFVDRHLGTNR
jgi:hypothetical protein